MILAAPPSLTSSRLARRTGMAIGVASGVLLLLSSLAGGFGSGAMGQVMLAQLVVLVIAPAVVAALARSFRAALQCLLWGFVFSVVTMFPVYVVASVRKFEAVGLLLLDDDLPLPGATVATNLGDAVSLLMLTVPGILVPLGVVLAALVATVARTIPPPTPAAR
jgi:hypothetical protein